MEENKDLVWDLNTFSEQARATEFVIGFENKLCVFSNSVNQLYTNYNIFVPKEENRKLVILPNPYAHHDTFNNIDPDAVTPTGLYIVAGETSEKGLLLSIPFKSGKAKQRLVPLQIGLRLVSQQLPANRAFLPILMKGDLREMNARTPCLHLHALNVDKLIELSALERSGIEQVIRERLAALT